MGADLTVLGSVEDCSLRCPFHHWEFNVAGQCTKIPYLKTGQSIPSAANAKSHKVRVFNKAVFTWWDAEGREPWFDIDDSAAPVMPPDYQLEGVVRYNLRCHVMDVKENLPDVAHLQHLHGEHSFYFLRYFFFLPPILFLCPFVTTKGGSPSLWTFETSGMQSGKCIRQGRTCRLGRSSIGLGRKKSRLFRRCTRLVPVWV